MELFFNTFWELLAEVKKYPKTRVCVAAASEEHVLLAVKSALEAGFVHPVLVGDEEKIWNLSVKISLDLGQVEIIGQGDPVEAAETAARTVGSGGADVLMKGMVNSSDFLKAVLRSGNGLSSGSILSHLAIFEVPGINRLIFKTDGGLNISPNLEQKVQITRNAVKFMQTLGIRTPRVAVLSPEAPGVEGLPSALDARKIEAMASRGEMGGAIVEGPMDLGLAIDYGEALRRGVDSPVAGKADLFIVPNIEVGNVFGKTSIYLAGAKMAGLVIGATRPVILTSRGDAPFSKLSSIAFACYYMMRYRGICGEGGGNAADKPGPVTA